MNPKILKLMRKVSTFVPRLSYEGMKKYYKDLDADGRENFKAFLEAMIKNKDQFLSN